MNSIFFAYCPTITGGKVLQFRPTLFPPYDKNGNQMYIVTDAKGNSIGWCVSCDGCVANVYDGPMDDGPSTSGPVYKTGEQSRRDLSSIYPALVFEKFESKAKKLLSFFEKNEGEGKCVVCGIDGIGLVLVTQAVHGYDRLELQVTTDLVTHRTVVMKVAEAELALHFLGDRCVTSVK